MIRHLEDHKGRVFLVFCLFVVFFYVHDCFLACISRQNLAR